MNSYVIMEFDVKIRSEEKPKNKYQVFCSIPPYVPLKENKFISSIFNFFFTMKMKGQPTRSTFVVSMGSFALF